MFFFVGSETLAFSSSFLSLYFFFGFISEERQKTRCFLAPFSLPLPLAACPRAQSLRRAVPPTRGTNRRLRREARERERAFSFFLLRSTFHLAPLLGPLPRFRRASRSVPEVDQADLSYVLGTSGAKGEATRPGRERGRHEESRRGGGDARWPTHAASSPAHCRGRAFASRASLPARLSLAAVAAREQPRCSSLRRSVHRGAVDTRGGAR